MPLRQGKSQKTISKNIETELNAHPDMDPKQAAAIAYSTARHSKDTDSAKEYDINDFYEIKNNPISKVGVFEYSGAQIGLPGLQEDKIYKVYRSEKELNNPETIESFKLIPFTDEHEMLGSADEGLTPAEHKGVHGVTGESVEFNHPYLTSNIKVFSSKLKNLIDAGKKELSIGYRCIYEPQNGEYDGNQYDFLQTNIRGNHLALVDEGRSGHDVAVLDHFTFTLDSKDLKMAEKDGDYEKEKGDMSKPKDKAKDEGEMSIKECREMLKKVAEHLDRMAESKDEFEDDLEAGEINEESNTTVDEGNPDAFVKRENGIDEAEEEGKKETEKKAEEEGDAKDEDMNKEEKTGRKEGAMDSKTMKKIMSQISARDQLAKRLSAHIGTFDHASKTVQEVAQYGVKKLGLSCAKGAEQYVLSGYLAGAKANVVATAQDHKVASGCIDAYLKGAK